MKIKKNKFKYFEIVKKPMEAELARYYSKKYYQNPSGSYECEYTSEAKQYFFNKLEQKFIVLRREGIVGGAMLDVGAGEGWAMQFFLNKGFAVKGIDYNTFGCIKHNPDCAKFLVAGNIYQKLEEEMRAQNKYDVIILDNVLEHVISPLKLLNIIRSIKKKKGILVIDVPNDFSPIQMHLLKLRHISTKFWIDSREHLSYFNKEGLRNLCRRAQFKCIDAFTDFPVDLFLFNKNTNYIKDKKIGKSCHRARVEIENLLHNISVEKTNALYRAMADLGIGRVLTMFVE